MEWKLLKKLKIELPYNPATPLLGIYPAKKHGLKGCMHSPHVHSSQNVDVIQMSIDRRMNKEDAVYIHKGILLTIKKNEMLPFAATCMGLELSHEVT